MRSPSSIVYYITAHGYGHGVRSCDILRALGRESAETPLHVVSGLPEDFLRARLQGMQPMPRIRQASLDVGMVQLDSIRTDVDTTLDRALDLLARWDDLVQEEAAYLGDVGAATVVADIPAIPLQAAKRFGIPAIAVGNFAWDWIYTAFVERDSRWGAVIERFRTAYAGVDLLLRLPFHEPMATFPCQVDLPLLTRPHAPVREPLARHTGASLQKRWILLSFTTLDWDEQALDRVAALDDYEFFTVLPLAWNRPNIRVVDRTAFSFGSVLASVDAVISKPGYGVVSECVVHGTPLIYADRTDFLEYPILVQAIERLLCNVHIPAQSLYDGELRPYLERIWTRPAPPEQMGREGDSLAARVITAVHTRAWTPGEAGERIGGLS